jgi:hypothetical protein
MKKILGILMIALAVVACGKKDEMKKIENTIK